MLQRVRRRRCRDVRRRECDIHSRQRCAEVQSSSLQRTRRGRCGCSVSEDDQLQRLGADAVWPPFFGLALASSASRSFCTSSTSGAELLGCSAKRAGTRFLSTWNGPAGLVGESSSSSMNVLALGTGLGPSEVNTVGGLRGDFAPVKPRPPSPERLP